MAKSVQTNAKEAKQDPEVSLIITMVAKLVENRQFRNVEASGKDRKVYNKYRLTGSKSKWKKGEDFVYSYETRLAGPVAKVKLLMAKFKPEDITELMKKHSDPHVEPYPTNSNDLKTRIITADNYLNEEDGPNSSDSYVGSHSDFYEREIEKYSEMTKKIAKDKRNAPSIEKVYTAFKEFIEKPQKGKKKVIKTVSNSERGKGVLRMANLGELYKNMKEDQIMNVFGYSNKDGMAEVISVGDTSKNEQIVDERSLYKVPNYLLISSRRSDVEYALKDLSRQSAIELTKNKIKSVLDEWAGVKKTMVESHSTKVTTITNKAATNGRNKRGGSNLGAKKVIVVEEDDDTTETNE